MNIETLQLIAQIIEERSVSKVAENEHISQSALSQHIKNVESKFNTKLFERTNRGIIPTISGEIFYRHAKNIVDCYDSLINELSNTQNYITKVKIFANPSFSSYALPCTLFDLQMHFPDIHIDMIVLPSLIVEQKIISGEGDIGFINGKPQNTQIWNKPILIDPIYLVAKQDYNIELKLNNSKLLNYPLIMSSGRSITRDNINSGLSKCGVNLSNLNIKYHMDTIESVKLSVLNGYGLSFLPYSSIKKELYNKQIKVIELENLSISNEFYLILNKQFIAKNNTLNEVINYLQNVLSDTLC